MDYDIREAFEAIENQLIESMMRNFKRHRAEEEKEGYRWSQWQGEQLKSLEKYRKTNATKFNKQFSAINAKVAEMLRIAREDGNADQEIAILEAIQNGFKVPDIVPDSMTGEFFKLNDRKLDALIKATTDDLEKAETAILRRANDQYRSAIFNAQVYANTGAGTYEKAVDMACRDMLRAGLACVEYSNGARHTLSDYAEMALRTANKRAYLYGEGEKRQEFGMSTVVVNSRQGGCSHCAQYIGKVFIDDVYSGGKKSDGNYPLLSTAIEGGLFHPRCKDSTSTYYEGITTLKPVSKEEMAEMDRREKLEEQQLYYKNQAKKNKRIADNSLDKDNQRIFQFRADENAKKADEIAEKLTKSIAKSDGSGIINIDIDEFVPCLRNNKTGKLVDTEVRRVTDYSLLSKCTERDGWDFPWNNPPKDCDVFSLHIKGSKDIEGLIALRKEPKSKAVYMYWGNSAPHNRVTTTNPQKRYNGVGGHLFAIAAELSVKSGYGGFIYGDAANKELFEVFTNEYRAISLSTRANPYRFAFEGDAVKDILNTYNYEWR